MPEYAAPRPGIAAWRRTAPWLAVCWLALIVLFRSEWVAMAGQWWDSSTYNHILLVPLILGWLVSMRWRAVLAIAPQGWWPGLVLFAGAAFAWLLGDLAGVALLSQLATVMMLQASFLALAGPRVGAALLFPLAYLLFLVPFGDEFVPLLQLVTARIVMALLHLAAIPATLDGVFITTPAGYFKVAEACSGVKFLIAMIAYGTLVCHVCYLRWPRRSAFMALSLVVPVLANGVRAWGTIVIAGWRGIEFAAGFDHIFYGWIFFAIVMALTVAAGAPWFDRPRDAAPVDANAILASAWLTRLADRRIDHRIACAAAMALAALALGWSQAASALRAPLPPRIDLPEVRGWHRVSVTPGYPWWPRHAGADHRLRGRYADTQGHVVDVSFALYAAQGEGREAAGFGEGAVPPGSGWSWERPGLAIAGGAGAMIEAPGPVRLLTETWYRQGSYLGGSNAALRLHTMAGRVTLRARPTSALIVAGPRAEDVATFVAATGPLGIWIDRIAAGHGE